MSECYVPGCAVQDVHTHGTGGVWVCEEVVMPAQGEGRTGGVMPRPVLEKHEQQPTWRKFDVIGLSLVFGLFLVAILCPSCR